MSQQVNLYHPIFRKQEKKFSARTLLQASAIVLVGIALMYVYALLQVRALRAQAVQVDNQYKAETLQLTDVSRQLAARQVNPRFEREVQRLQGQIVAVQRIREIAKHDYFSGAAGYSNYFIAFARQSMSGLWLTGFTVTGAGEQLSLEGRTESPELVPQYLRKLSSEKLLAGTEFEVFHMTRPEEANKKGLAGYVDFNIKTADRNKGP